MSINFMKRDDVTDAYVPKSTAMKKIYGQIVRRMLMVLMMMGASKITFFFFSSDKVKCAYGDCRECSINHIVRAAVRLFYASLRFVFVVNLI